jgi:hypothetical protein
MPTPPGAPLSPLLLDVESSEADPSSRRRPAGSIEWNAPSFRTSEHFATTNLREKKGVGIIFHLGAKARTLPQGGMVIDDSTNLLKWLASVRAVGPASGRPRQLNCQFGGSTPPHPEDVYVH